MKKISQIGILFFFFISCATSEISENKKKTVISFIYDDGYVENELSNKILSEYGYPTDFALVSSIISKETEQRKYFYHSINGSILCHSDTHLDMREDNISKESIDNEMIESKILLNNLNFEIKGYVSPNSKTNEKYIEILKLNYDYSFTIEQTIESDGSAHNVSQCDPHRLKRLSMTNPIEKIKLAVDNVIKKGGWLVFYDHRTGLPWSADENKTRQILNYVKSKKNKIKILNSDKAYEYFF
jgi:peptidoglycan/xylan/chitin deacetylase (PgdA/CDA1 family)